MRKFIAVFTLVLAMLLSVTMPANAVDWRRNNSATDSTRVTDDINVYTTVFYRSGTTKPNWEGKKRTQVYKIVHRYRDKRDNSCDRLLNQLNNVFWKTTIEDRKTTWKVGGNRVTCDPDGNGRVITKYPKTGSRAAPIMRGNAQAKITAKAEFDRGNDHTKNYDIVLGWLGLHLELPWE